MTGGKLAIGIDIGGTNLRAARVTAAGEILDRVSTRSGRHPQAVADAIIDLASSLDTPEVAAIGIGIPGRVDVAGQTVLSGGYVDLASIDLAGLIGKALRKPAFLDNDANMALVAEMAVGAARGKANVALLTIGTGIGGALAQGGRIQHGRATAGQLGHIAVEAEGQACNCGRRGCVETTSSGTALARHIAEAGLPAGTGIDEIIRLDSEGNAAAAAVLRAWAGPLRSALDTISAVADPELMLLGGGLGAAAHRALSGMPAASPWFRYAVAPASLGDDAGVVGAAVAALGRGRHSTRGKAAVLVNGVPASGKSRIARTISGRTGWPLLTLDTVKNPFLTELGGADRAFNRTLGRASYRAIWDLVADAPDGSAFVVDAWFGFQPKAVLEGYLRSAGVTSVAEVWCHAPGDVLAERYAARLDQRPAGHPGAEYIPELIALAARAAPMRLGEVYDLDTSRETDAGKVHAWLERVLPRAEGGSQ